MEVETGQVVRARVVYRSRLDTNTSAALASSSRIAERRRLGRENTRL